MICIHDVSSIYKVPLILENYGILDFLKEKLRLDVPVPLPLDFMLHWKNLVARYVKKKDFWTRNPEKFQILKWLDKTILFSFLGNFTKWLKFVA